MVYEHCLTERNATLFNIFGQLDKIPDEIPASGTLLNVTTGNGTLDSLIMPELPECDLEKELDNVSPVSSFPYNSHYCNFQRQYFSSLSIVGIGDWVGVHHIHGSDQSISRRSILVRVILPHAVHPGNRFSIRHAGRGGHEHRRHETVPEFAQRNSHRFIFLSIFVCENERNNDNNSFQAGFACFAARSRWRSLTALEATSSCCSTTSVETFPC